MNTPRHTCRRLRTVLAATGVLLCVSAAVMAGDLQEQRMIPMRLEIELDAPQCVVLENFTLRLRIVNPNPFLVRLRGFEFGYIEPEIHGAGPGFPDGEFRRLYYGAMDSALRREPVLVPGHGSIEHHRFLFGYFSPERWPIEPGRHYLRPKTHLSRTYGENEDQRIPIEWTYDTVEFRVLPADFDDQRAFTFLRERLRERDEEVRRGTGERPEHVFRAELFGEFLERYGETAYAPEIRWELTKILESVLQDKVDRDKLGDVPGYIRLFSEGVRYCLKRGSPYADDFLEWDIARGRMGTMNSAFDLELWDLMEDLAAEIDRRNPEDKAGKLYRRALIPYGKGALGEARHLLETVKQRFPEGPYVKPAQDLLSKIERRQPRE